MDAGSPRWTTVSDSPHDHEREALAFLRSRLYDREPYRVWANFEFVAPNGALYEVDALAITDNGVHLIEIKSHPGEFGGDATTWQWTMPDGRRRTLDNPRILANRKAKALKAVIARSKAFAKHRRDVPYVSEVVFLSDSRLRVSLSPPGRFQVHGRDPDKGEELPAERKSIGGIIDALTDLTPNSSGRPRRRIDRPLGARVAKAVEEVGIREQSARRRVRDYVLGELLDDVEADPDTGVAYQDFRVTHADIPGMVRRLRVYPLERNATSEQRAVAARAAKREFEYLRQLEHPGIAAPVDYIDHDRGPCLLFDYDEGYERLDQWLLGSDVDDKLDVYDRLEIVRLITEALDHAHRNGVYHRALCPTAIAIKADGDVKVQVGNWHAGARISTEGASTSATGTSHVEALSAADAALFRAPEHGQPLADPAALDAFSLGCVACFVLTGVPPAPTPAKLRDLLTTQGCVDLNVVADGVDETLAVYVAELTDKDAGNRYTDLDRAMRELDGLEDQWTAPDQPTEPHVLSARKGATLAEGRFAVLGRLGTGSTALTLLVKDGHNHDRISVLKVALEIESNERLKSEADALKGLRHSAIVEVFDGPLEVDGHAAILVSYAGPKVDEDKDAWTPRTLASRIGEQVGAELAERFGEDLLDAVRYLEQMGVGHRDIKPDNLAVAPRGDRDELHLVLFDFSLAGVPIDRVQAGTQGYIDPFLANRGSWDPAAERYSAAVVLYEICTGERPIYGDGMADPTMVDDDVAVDPDAFESGLGGSLAGFFEQALARDAKERFDTADEMLWAWRQAFRVAKEPVGGPGSSLDVPDGTTASTPLVALGLSNRAVNALEREDILTVGDLLATPRNRLAQFRGVGAQTRRELIEAVAVLRDVVTSQEIDADAPLTAAAEQLVPRVTKATASSAEAMRRFLGLDDERTHHPLPRSTQAKAAERWSKQPPVTSVRTWVNHELRAVGGVAAIDQLADRLARSRPGAQPDEDRVAARALLLAADLVEGNRTSPRWVRRMLGGGVVALAVDEEGGLGANRLADYGAALAERTAEVIADRTVVSRSELVTALREVTPPDGADVLPDAMLAEVGAALCAEVAVNSRLELYRRGLSARDALSASRRALVGLTRIKPDELAAKVAGRFPNSEPLPQPPELDALLAEVGIALTFDRPTGTYTAPEPDESSSAATSIERLPTSGPVTPVPPAEISAAADFEDRLRRSIDQGLLVLVTDRKSLEAAAAEVARLAVTMVDLDQWLIGAMEDLTKTGPPSWEVVVKADAAGPGSSAWANLGRLVDRALDALTERLAATTGTVTLTNCGLLARYARLNAIARWRDVMHDPDTELRGLWMIVATSGASDVPLLDGEPVPVITRNEWTRIPREWLGNVHRAGTAT